MKRGSFIDHCYKAKRISTTPFPFPNQAISIFFFMMSQSIGAVPIYIHVYFVQIHLYTTAIFGFYSVSWILP